MYENSNMDGTFDAAATANNYLLLYGAFENFVIRTPDMEPRPGR